MQPSRRHAPLSLSGESESAASVSLALATLAGMTAVHRVAIVVAATFTAVLETLAHDRHVWALRLPEYERVARKRWSTAEAEDLESGITLFNGNGLSPEAELVDIWGTVEEHHGVYSHTPAVSEVEVIGAEPTADVRAELSAYGFDDVATSERGFIARRDAPT